MTSPVKSRWVALGLLLAAIALPFAVSPGAAQATIHTGRLIEFLNQTIALYRETAIQAQSATDPEDQVLLYDNGQIANQVVAFAFDFARAQANAMSAQPASATAANAGPGTPQSAALRQMLGNLDKLVASTKAEADSDSRELASATGAKRAKLESTVSELQGELALDTARRDAVRSMAEFASNSGTSGLSSSDLKSEIEALAASVPAASSNGVSARQARSAQAPPAPAAASPELTGIWDLSADLFALSSKIRTIDTIAGQTKALLKTSDDLRSPFIAQMRDLSSQGDHLAAQADTANPAQLAEEKQQLDALAAQFKQVSAAVIPLSKQRVLLLVYQKNLENWRGSVQARYRSELRSLGIRLGLLGLVIVILVGLSELWRRLVYRYVREPRRRYQFLLLRRLALWIVIGLMIAFMLAGRLSSFVTFAGLLTAGVAVALQNVIVAVVGYFFLIGKFGIRVGDRVEVSGISGEVIDIGLVRFHLMELGAGATPTGRVVAFSNSVVFQPTAGLFKRIPGASFAWHQVTLTVPRETDLGSLKKNLLGAVEVALHDYRGEIERLYGEMEKRGILFSEYELQPQLDLHLTAAGVEATIRYPVDLGHATDIDARVSHELLTALEHDSKLQTAGGPEIRLKTDITASSPQ
jgi:small-conductance mechanosensitive channel